MALLSIENISKSYNNSKALQNINMEVEKGRRVGIVGETGSGKSTLLKIIAGLESPTEGKVRLNGERVLGPDEQLVPGHPSIGYLQQDFGLPRFTTVEEYIYDPYSISEMDVDKLYHACHIGHLVQKDTRELSGGEKQRVALAKLLVKDTSVLLLDEPFSNLDLNHRNVIKTVIENIEAEYNTTIILVSHDPLDALSWAEEVLVMRGGRIVQQNTPQNVYYHPQNEYVAGLFGSYNLLNPDKWNIQVANFHRLGDQIIVRPEAVAISKSDDADYKGMVVQRYFYGSHDEVIVEVGTDVIVVKTIVGLVQIGDIVSLQLK